MKTKYALVVHMRCTTCDGSGDCPVSYYGEKCFDCEGVGSFPSVRIDDILDAIREEFILVPRSQPADTDGNGVTDEASNEMLAALENAHNLLLQEDD